MVSTDTGYSYKHVGTPGYELKCILIALRKINEIPIGEMSQRIGVSVSRLREFERVTFLSDFYNEHYIDALDEYVSLASKQCVPFREALKIYINQKCLYKLNITAKLTLFGKILYESLEVNRRLNEEDDIAEDTNKTEGTPKYRVWSESRYDTAFFLLASLRKMLDVEENKTAKKLGMSVSTFKELEKGVRKYETLSDLRVLVISYSKILTDHLKEKEVDKDVYKIVSTIIENGYTLSCGDLKLKKILLDEIYKED